MNARHVATLQTALHTRVPVSVGTCRGSVIVVSAGTRDARNICVWQVFYPDKKVLTLKGHNGVLKSLALSPPGSLCLLCSVAEDSAILWNIESCSAGKVQQEVVLTSLTVETAGPASFNETSSLVAVCRGCDVLVFTTMPCQLDTTLSGHTAPVTGVVFSAHHSNLIITISEDRTFKVWDLEKSMVAFQSAIISASPFVCACMDPLQNHLFTITADGKLRVYDMVLGSGHAKLQECDIEKELQKMVSHSSCEDSDALKSGSVPHSMASKQLLVGSAHPCAQAGPLVVGMYYWRGECPQDEKGEEQLLNTLPSVSVPSIRHVLGDHSRLLVTTPLGLLCLNASTLEPLSYLDFREPLPPTSSQDDCVVPTTSCCDVIGTSSEGELCCVFGAMFDGSVSVVSLKANVDSLEGIRSVISVLPSAPLSANSLLKAELMVKHPPSVPTKKPSGVRGRTLGVVDKPLTFKSKVKSSGYAECPRTRMFVPKTHKSAQNPSSGKSSSAAGISSKREYPSTEAPPTEFVYSSQLSERSMAINGTSFSGTGSHLSCACSDGTVHVLRPLPQGSLPQGGSGRECTFVGHDAAVYSSSWSHDGRWLVTCSADQTARLWAQGRQEPLLVFNSTQHNFKSDKHLTTSDKSNTPFTKEITSAQFYYLDRFILLSAGNSFFLYKYHIDTAKVDDIKRYLSTSHYKLVKEFVMTTAQKITALSSVNDFHSYITLVAGSNRSLEVHDMNVGQCVCTLEDVHSRPVNCIAQNKGSRYITHPPPSYDLFLTSAVADGVKLWDLRTSRCVSRFTAHKNASLPLSATFSPCARYICTGSEDRCAYIYDIRSPAPLHKLSGHSDVVSTVCYHPSRVMLATGTLSGEIKYFVNQSTS